MNNKVLDCIALTIAIIGAVNWGLIGFFSFDLVALIFGNMTWISRIIYALVGLSGLYLLTFYMYAGGTEKNGNQHFKEKKEDAHFNYMRLLFFHITSSTLPNQFSYHHARCAPNHKTIGFPGQIYEL